MNRRDFAAAISALPVYFGCGRIAAPAAEPRAKRIVNRRSVTILKGPDDCPCRIFDANGVEIMYATYAEIETGVVEQLVCDDSSGKPVFALDNYREIKRSRKTFPAPLTYIRG